MDNRRNFTQGRLHMLESSRICYCMSWFMGIKSQTTCNTPENNRFINSVGGFKK